MPSGIAPAYGQGTQYGDTSVVTDVTDWIFQLTPEDKPFFYLCDDKPASVEATQHQWQRRELTVRQPNAQFEGFSYTFTSPSRLPVRESNWLQIAAKDIRLSNTNQAIGHYAIPNFRADQVETQLAELGTDLENALLRATLNTGATGTARMMLGIIPMIQSLGTLYTNVTAATFTEGRFNSILEDGWSTGASLKDALVDGRMKRAISQFTGNASRIINADAQRLVNAIDVYDSEYGPINVHLSRDMPTFSSGTSLGRSLLLVDKTMLAKAWLRTVGVSRTAQIADSEDYIAVCELTLEFGHRNGHALVANTVAFANGVGGAP
jgi:hypothetical protein